MKTTGAIMLVAISIVACQNASMQATSPEAAGAGGVPQVEPLKKRTGETFTVTLDANHTTGYSWALDGKEDSTVVRKMGSEYVSNPHAPGMVGFGGTEHWKFRGERHGTTVLHFIYCRPWEKDVKPVQERSIKVVVE